MVGRGEHQGDLMMTVAMKAPAYMLFRSTGKPRMLPFNLTLSVSYDCNSRCRTCNIWKRKADDLTLDEYEKIFRKLGKSVFWATLSGGEPFLRKDIDGIASSLYKNCRPRIINIPTNGLLGPYIAKKVERIAEACPESELVVNLSLDGIGDRHDEIRGVKGNFERSMQAYKALRGIKAKNLSIGIHTVVSRFNVKEIPRICDFVLEERVELGTIGQSITPSAEEYAEAVACIKQKTAATKTKGVSRFTKAFRNGYYEFAKQALSERSQPIPCYAGIASGQISPEGDVWGCCVRAEPLGNLRENDYDFKRVWFSGKADAFRKSVKEKKCACPLANAYYSSAVCDMASVAKAARRLI
jgi:MoaA/NifB/PqqE/SkfB family radical SAM enzyme